jgi:hypothetical protein
LGINKAKAVDAIVSVSAGGDDFGIAAGNHSPTCRDGIVVVVFKVLLVTERVLCLGGQRQQYRYQERENRVFAFHKAINLVDKSISVQNNFAKIRKKSFYSRYSTKKRRPEGLLFCR